MLRILAIGNSFSEDALTYLYDIAKASGEEWITANLYIGGCPLHLHWENATENRPAYLYTKTGTPSRQASILEGLLDEPWDIVTLQQSSPYSGMWETYEPYLSNLSAYVKAYAPDAKQWIHQTWAYEWDSSHEGFTQYEKNQQVMYQRLCSAYRKAADKLQAPIIPCGDAMQLARQNPLYDKLHGGISLCRDGFHASYTHGRYLLGAVWFEALSSKSVVGNTFIPSNQSEHASIPSPAELDALQLAAHEAVTSSAM